MICKIADLITEIPAAGDLISRCKDYMYEGNRDIDVRICTENFRTGVWRGLAEKDYIYMESGSRFYFELLKYRGMMIHASAVELNGRAYLFSGPSGTGKSTHSLQWKKLFGDDLVIINDDKPALREIEGKWYAFGTPWCGKDGINCNKKVPLAGICFLKQSSENSVRVMNRAEAIQNIVWQTKHRFTTENSIDLMMQNVGSIVEKIPVIELRNRPDIEAAKLSYKTMYTMAVERSL